MNLSRLPALLVACGVLSAEPLTLNRAVELARQHSPVILESAANLDAVTQSLREARASRFPSFEIHEVFVRTDSPADVFGMKLMQGRFSFPAFVQSDPNRPAPVNNFATEIQGSVPLYTGGRITAGIGQAEQMKGAAEQVLQRTGDAVAFMVTSAYMDVLLADRFVELAAKARDTTARHVDQAQAYFDAGMIVESDLLLARVQLARMEENLISARNGALLARAGLNRLMGVEQSAEWELSADLHALDAPTLSLEEARRSAFERRADVKAVAAKIQAASLGVRRARGEFLPEIALVGSYTLNDDSFLGSNGRSYKLMAMARWNVLDFGKVSAKVARSRAEETAAKESGRAYLQQVEFEVRQAWQGAAEARGRHDVAASAVSSAEKALSILEARFEQGIAKVTDLLDSETTLNEARTRELQARFDLQRSIRALGFATNISFNSDKQE